MRKLLTVLLLQVSDGSDAGVAEGMAGGLPLSGVEEGDDVCADCRALHGVGDLVEAALHGSVVVVEEV